MLDVGVSGKFFAHYTFEDFYPYRERVTAGSIQFDDIETARRAYPLPAYAVFDGCSLPFPDKSFDIVFSNAVIEHIIGDGKQAQFARELMRVGRSWFVTTPNYWFPLEPHYHLPFIQFCLVHSNADTISFSEPPSRKGNCRIWPWFQRGSCIVFFPRV